jgi:hypothetical protein
MSSWTSQPHQLAGTARPVSADRSNTMATDIGEPGLTSTVHASNSSWHTASQCTSTTVPSAEPSAVPFTVMLIASVARRANRLSGEVQEGGGPPGTELAQGREPLALPATHSTTP